MLGPATSVSMIERTAARNTSMLTLHEARRAPCVERRAGTDFGDFALLTGRRLRNFAG